MRGRTMYVLPYCMGPLDAAEPMLGVEITDSAYVVASMHIMTRLGTKALELFTKDGVDQPFVPGLHSVGAPLEPGQARRAVAVQRHQVHRPLPRGAADLVATARATAATPCWARSATRCASPR